MSDLLKEAIADAKAVRETALQNAKMALEEAFTPQLKSMLVAKLKEDDLEGEEEYGDEEEVPEEEPEIPADEMSYEDEFGGDEEGGEEEFGDEEGGEEEFGDEEGGEEEFEEEGLDLEAIIRELEAELSEEHEEGLGESEESDDKPVEEASEESDEESVNEEEEETDTVDETSSDDEDTVDEVDQSSSIGKGTGRGNTDRSSGIGSAGKAVEKVKFESVQAELKEYKEAVTYLKDKLHEVNILNAKLLFTNKLFKEFVLDNNQKLKVVETFDRAQTTREIKLVYSTLAEQFGDNNVITKRKSIKESASTAVGSTKPSKESSKVITEESQVANRFRKLAGILKD